MSGQRFLDFADARVLITGGTGSFGCRFAAQLRESGAREVRIFSRDEKKQFEMRMSSPDFTYMVGDVRDRSRLKSAMRSIDYVFHAAALKQVPSCEEAPFEAVKTNVVGSQNVCEAAIESGVKVLVALSTDKAVKPVNAMGMTKALMEKIVCSYNSGQYQTRLCCVRYGNVMGSRGSVIPMFRSLISRGEPLIVTVPSMTRFLMSLDESVDLVVRAMARARGGEIFVRKAPACTIMDLADAMRIKYSPRGIDHKIVVCGSRPGEKLHETLVNEYEMLRAHEGDTYFTIEPEYRPVDTSAGVELGAEYTSENTRRISSVEDLGSMIESAVSSESLL